MATKQWRPRGYVRPSVRREDKQQKKAQSTVVIVLAAASTSTFRDAAQSHALKALEALVWLCEHAKSEAARVSAANALLDRAHGRPVSGAKTVLDDDAGDAACLEVQWLDPEKS